MIGHILLGLAWITGPQPLFDLQPDAEQCEGQSLKLVSSFIAQRLPLGGGAEADDKVSVYEHPAMLPRTARAAQGAV